MDYRDKLIHSLAERECTRICRATIRYLNKLDSKALLSGEDSGLKNVWDEICVQSQGQESFFWQAYLDTITPYISYAVEHLRRPEQEAIWLLTPEATNWETEQEDRPVTIPVCLDDIIQYIRDHYVLQVAIDYHNARIDRFLQTPFDGVIESKLPRDAVHAPPARPTARPCSPSTHLSPLRRPHDLTHR